MARETMAQFVERRRREIEGLGREAEAAAHEAFRKAIRAGENLRLSTPGQVRAYGAGLLRKAQPASPSGRVQIKSPEPSGAKRTGSQSPVVRRDALAQRAQDRSWLDSSSTARAVGGDLARGVGNVAGVARGAWHAAEGLGQGAVFVARLANPLDQWMSWPGESAVDELSAGVRAVGDYARNGISNPGAVARDIQRGVHQMRIDLDPSATPAASTLAGELRRNFDIGKNQGELAFNVGSLAVGGPGAKAAGRLAAGRRASSAGKYIDLGFGPEAAAHLAAPYEGMGHHSWPRRMKPPPWFVDSEFNVLKPGGISRGDFYELHYQVDPRFHGAGLPRRFGESWSGKALGLEKHGLAGRLWDGSPAPLKARLGGLGASAGGTIYEDRDGEGR